MCLLSRNTDLLQCDQYKTLFNKFFSYRILPDDVNKCRIDKNAIAQNKMSQVDTGQPSNSVVACSISAATRENQHGFQTGPTQTELYKQRRWLEAGNFGFMK